MRLGAWLLACIPVARTRRDYGRVRGLCWAIVVWPFSTSMPAPTSRWCPPMAATPSYSMARFTTSANCAASWRRRVWPSAPRPIPKFFYRCSPTRASACCPGCAACSPSPSGIHRPASYFWHAIPTASSRSITHARRTACSSLPRSRRY